MPRLGLMPRPSQTRGSRTSEADAFILTLRRRGSAVSKGEATCFETHIFGALLSMRIDH
jgi:hypothetical protein